MSVDRQEQFERALKRQIERFSDLSYHELLLVLEIVASDLKAEPYER